MELFNLDCFVDAVAPAGKPFSCDRRYIVALQFLDYPLVLLQSAGVDDDACLELGTGKRCVVEADAAELDFLLTQVCHCTGWGGRTRVRRPCMVGQCARPHNRRSPPASCCWMPPHNPGPS